MEKLTNLTGKAATFATMAGFSSGFSAWRAGAAFVIAALVLFAAESGQAAPLGIEPMTVVNEQAHTGYFQDPYPVHKAPFNSPGHSANLWDNPVALERRLPAPAAELHRRAGYD